MARIIFVTGVDTGAGKTIIAAHSLDWLRRSGCNALGMKPFCTGGRGDARLLRQAQQSALTLDEINPFHFPDPLAPLVAARAVGRRVELGDVLERIEQVAKRCETLIIEGAGGLMSPLGEGFDHRDLIARLPCEVVVAARNRLGVINHASLTALAMQAIGVKRITVALLDVARPGLAARTNAATLREILQSARVVTVNYLGERASSWAGIKNNRKKMKKTLAQFLDHDNFTFVLPKPEGKTGSGKPLKVGERNRSLR